MFKIWNRFYICFRGYKDFGVVEQTVGLWRVCRSNAVSSGCANLKSTCSDEPSAYQSACHKMLASRVFVTIACIISALSVLSLAATVVIQKDSNRIFIIISVILLILSLVAGIIGVALGIAFVTNSPFEHKLAASGIIGIVAVIINAIAVVVAGVMVR